MPSKHKTKLIGWNSADPTLKAWIEAEASRCGLTVRAFLDEVLATERARRRDMSAYEVTHKDGDLTNNDISNIEIRKSTR